MALVAWSGCAGDDGDPPGSLPEGASDPGRVTLHRLNRAEYDATVRDLLFTDLRPAQEFPPDDFGEGFDNIAAVLSLSPLHLEMYELAADTLIQGALVADSIPPELRRIEAESDDAIPSVGGPSGDGWMVWTNGTIDTNLTLEHPGRYRIAVRAWGTQAGDEPVLMALRADAAEVARFDVPGDSSEPEVFEVEVDFTAGGHSAGAAFLNDFVDQDTGADRNLIVDWIEVEGPLDRQAPPPPGRDRVFTCTPEDLGERECAREILAGFGKRAWRRPLSDGEVTRLLDLYELSRASGGNWEEGVLLSIKAILVSHNFVFRVERDPAPDSATPRMLSAWELATRLSYFLWSSMPDDELFAAAEDGSVLEPEVIEEQVRRMLADPRAEALVDNFAGQWLYIRGVDNAAPDYQSFPEWSEELRASMKEEMRRMASDIFFDDRSMLDLLTAKETWIDANLAAHYGREAPEEGWTRVSVDGNRSGLLTTAGLLTALSYPTRTSPVRRGKWVLENMMCQAPPPPPAGVEGLPEDAGAELSLREQMERHRADPACASCHATMDPIGFGLEHFDATGAYRDIDAAGFPVDASGELPGELAFDGAAELAAVLAEDPRVPHCMVERAFTYALGRATTKTDKPYLEQIEGQFAAGDYRFEALAIAIAQSEPFRYRRGEPADSQAASESIAGDVDRGGDR